MSNRRRISSQRGGGAPPPRLEQDRLSETAKHTAASQQKPPAQGLVSSAEQIAEAIDNLYLHVLNICSQRETELRAPRDSFANAVARKILGGH